MARSYWEGAQQDARLMAPDGQVRTAWSGATSPDVGFRCAAAR
ncbi:MAG TPA: hypothetical protein VGK52_12055 [Polyangia bacterium]|jgi:hypothetical protein